MKVKRRKRGWLQNSNNESEVSEWKRNKKTDNNILINKIEHDDNVAFV